MAAALVSASPRVQVMAVLLPDPILAGVCVGVNRISTDLSISGPDVDTNSWHQSSNGFDPTTASFGIDFSFLQSRDPNDPLLGFMLREDGTPLSFEVAAVPEPGTLSCCWQ